MNRRVLIISALLLLFVLYLKAFPFQEMTPLKKAFSDFPLRWKGWVGEPQHFDDEILEKLKVKEYILSEYMRDPSRVNLYIGYYGTQRAGAQIHSPKHCLPGAGWFRISEKVRTLTFDSVGKINVVQAVYQKGDSKEVFIYWYKMKNACITNDYVLKMYMALNALRYRRNDAAFVRLSAIVTGTEQEAIRSIEDFMGDFLPILKGYLPE